MTSYKEVVEFFESASNAHEYVQSFAHGPLDYLDAHSQNIKYPFVFLRPLQSPGLSQDTRIRTINFELYVLDVPRLQNQSPIDIMSRTEQVLYDIGSYLNWGPPQDNQTLGVSFDISNIIPALEAFNDRAYGWIGNIAVQESGVYNYCDYPSN
jgi:hypothetical protein